MVLSGSKEMKRHSGARKTICGGLLVFALLRSGSAQAYAVLSHEAIVDAAWETHIKPLLLKKYPQATEEDLSRAQAYEIGRAHV